MKQGKMKLSRKTSETDIEIILDLDGREIIMSKPGWNSLTTC